MAAEPGLEIVRVLPASVEEVFRSWTDPDELRRWMSPLGEADVEVDPRVGGRLRVVMVGGGMRIEHTGRYVEVDPPSMLSFTWRSEYTGDADTLVKVRLRPHPEGTELRLTHTGLPADAVASHGEGWGRILDRLSERLR